MRYRLTTLVFLLIVAAFASRFLLGLLLGMDRKGVPLIIVIFGVAALITLPAMFVFVCWDEFLSWFTKIRKLDDPPTVDATCIAEQDNSEWLADRNKIGPPE